MKIVYYKNIETGRLSTSSFRFFMDKFNNLFDMFKYEILYIGNYDEISKQ